MVHEECCIIQREVVAKSVAHTDGATEAYGVAVYEWYNFDDLPFYTPNRKWGEFWFKNQFYVYEFWESN